MITKVVYVPLSCSEVERELAALLDLLARDAPSAGVRLVELGFRLPECLRESMALLAEMSDVDGSALAGFAAGFTRASREGLFAEQEDLHAALRRAKDSAERGLKASEARFTEVFDTSALGMLITDLDGGVVRANEAIEVMLGYPGGALLRKHFDALVDPEDADYLRSRYAELAEGAGTSVCERARFRHADGDTVWTRVAVSALRDADGVPDHFVTMVEDISDLHLLEHRITYQGTHDALTGLPNRSAFSGRLEEALAGGAEVAVLHLSLDDFAMVNDGIGRHAGERLLIAVAGRLADVVAGRDAVIARVADHEFAILLHSADAGPLVAAEVNDALDEPTYVDGLGIALSATVALVVRPRADTDPGDLLRATDITVRELRSRGRRQWGTVDVAEVADRVDRWALTAAIPGAWENGELDIDFDAVVSLDSAALVAARATLRWDNPARGRIAGDLCATLLGDTGMGVCVGRWQLSRAAERVGALRDRLGVPLRLYVELTADLASDPDLVAAVRKVSAEAALPLTHFDIGLPVTAAAFPDGPGADNVAVLADLGAHVVLTETGRGMGDLACLAELPVHSVRVNEQVAHRVAADIQTGETTLITKAVRASIPLIREEGVSVIIPAISTARVAEWWTEAGADLAQGPLYGTPGPVEDLVSATARPLPQT